MGHVTMPAELAEIIETHRRLFGGFTMSAQIPEPPVGGAGSPAPADAPPPDPAPSVTDDEQLGEPGKRALAAERKAARDAQRQLVEARAQLQAIEDAGKSELQKATDAAAKAQADADEARQELARERVARKHGLSDEDLELLTGTEEQMERLAARITISTAPATGDPKASPVPGIGKTPETRNIPLAAQVAAAEADGNKALVATLKAMQLATPAV